MTKRLQTLRAEAFGRALRILRAWRGETQISLGLKLGVTPTYICNLERGRKRPKAAELSRIGAALKSSGEDILTLTAKLLNGSWKP